MYSLINWVVGSESLAAKDVDLISTFLGGGDVKRDISFRIF